MMLDTWDNKIFYPRFYDCDTICSYDNSGQLKFDVDIEMAQGYWNTSSSRLWTRIRDLMHDDLVAKYNDMRQNGLSYESLMQCFYDEQIAKIPQKYYNMDYDIKYAPFSDSYLGMANGDTYEHLKRWLKNRLIFVDTLYDYAPSYNNDMLTIRANTTEPMTIYIETYTPVYQHLSWYNGQMDKKKIDGKVAVEFTGTAMAATDQEVLIYGGTNVKKITGISSMNPNRMLIGSATRLIELDAHDCPLLSDINANKSNLAPHVYLNKVNLSGCPLLGGNLIINNSPLVREIDIRETGIVGLNLPTNLRNLEKLTLNDSIKTLSLEDVPLLTDIMIPSDIEYLCIENAPRLTNLTGSSCTKLETFIAENVGFNPISQVVSKANNLKRIRLIDLDIACSYTDILKISKLIGVDKNGADAPISECVTGKVTLATCSEAILEELETSLPNVDFTVLTYTKSFTVTFVDGDGNIIYECETLENGEAIYLGDTPTKTSTAQYDYIWKGWDRQLKPVLGDAVVTATFDAELRYYTVRFINSDTQEVISSQYLGYGTIPTKPELPDGFNAWNPSIIDAVTENKDYYTQYIPYPNNLDMFTFTTTTVDGINGYRCTLESSYSDIPGLLIIPFEYNGLPVIEYAQSSKTTLPSINEVYIPESIIKLGSYAFYGMSNVEELELSNIKYIGDDWSYSQFQDCSKLKNLVLPKVRVIWNASSNGGLACNCTNLEVVILGSEEYPFYQLSSQYNSDQKHFRDCSNLAVAMMITENGQYSDVTYSDGTNLSNIKYSKYNANIATVDGFGFVYTPELGICYKVPDSITEVRIPSHVEGVPVTILAGKALVNHTNITAVYLSEVVEFKGDFEDNYKQLQIVDAPKLVNVSSWFLSNCTAVHTVNMPSISDIPTSAFRGCTKLVSINIPNATSLSGSCFYGCTKLVSINIPNATSLEGSCFYGCTKLVSINIPNATSLGGSCFYKCTSLTSIDLPKVTSLGSSCFNGCTSLTSVDLPKVTSLGSSCFKSCTSLTSITLGYIEKPISNTSNFSTTAFSTYVLDLSIYVTSPSSPPTLTGSPWGATNATITYEQA